jgi:hypothetical protein
MAGDCRVEMATRTDKIAKSFDVVDRFSAKNRSLAVMSRLPRRAHPVQNRMVMFSETLVCQRLNRTRSTAELAHSSKIRRMSSQYLRLESEPISTSMIA